ncbi:hypothetical protein ACIO1C_01890 [Streptomyces sp. NPDC087420]|uniref:hypothetical protein n=1 Tax=Streptomyces sp. NPDC087420 TaxID=3365785 RepID=UPI00383604BF
MSGSTMYSFVAVDPVTLALGLAVSAGLAAARRARERERAEQRAALAAERARRTALRLAELARQEAEFDARRDAERDAHAAGTRRERGRAESRRLDEVERLIARMAADTGHGGPLTGAGRRLAELRGLVGGETPLEAAIEELRAQVVVLRPAGAAPAGRTDQYEVLAALERRLADTSGAPGTGGDGTGGAAYDEEGRRNCAELLGRLRAAAGPQHVVRFEAVLGGVEHALARHESEVARHTSEAVRAAGAVRQAEQRAEEARRERAEALRELLAEAVDRFGVVEPGAREAVRDAVELGAPELARELETALRAVTAPLTARRAEAALTALAALERLLPSAEERLDDLQLAHSRRGDLARALKDAMTGAGLAFTGGEDRGTRLVLSFERPSGATYEATVGTDGEGDPVLTYHVDNEADMALRPAAEGAVCTPEELLDRVHGAMGEEGFRPGRLTWEGRPPRGAARLLPGDEARRPR